jgi:hypothetical protein
VTRDDGVHRFVPPILRPLSIGIGRGVRSAHHSLRGAFSRVHPTPIFVLGNQKSGTSAIAALLARACGLSVSLDMLQETRRPIFQHVVRGELDFERYVRVNRWEFSHDVVKEPNLSLLYPQLAAYFAASPFVFVMRDPRDNLRSLLNGLAIPGDLETLEARHRHRVNAGWKLVLDGRWLGIEGTHYIEQLAGRWVHLARIYLAHADRMHLCRYEIFAADKLAELRRLAGLLSRPVVADVSGELERAFQPSGDRSVRWEAFFGERNLARIEAVCGETMLALGYSPSRLRG